MQRKQLLLANRQIRKSAQSDVYKNNCNRLMSVPGIGTMAAITFLVQIGDIKRFTRLDELCNYVGLVPSMHGSGEKMEAGELIKKGEKRIKNHAYRSWLGSCKKISCINGQVQRINAKDE